MNYTKFFRIYFIILILLFGWANMEANAQKKGKIIYKYKKYEKFDFEDLVIEGETSSPGDLTISPRFQQKFKNPLPYRKNFNAEIKKAIERVK